MMSVYVVVLFSNIHLMVLFIYFTLTGFFSILQIDLTLSLVINWKRDSKENPKKQKQ